MLRKGRPLSNKFLFTRNIDAGAHLDAFLVSAIGAILLIRAYLHITGYPQVGAGGLHIAHMLWGGLAMAAAITIFFSFLNLATIRAAVVIGGIGFGMFIDEVGKFVTKDNDYFFQPSIAIMYATFVLFYLAGRWIQGRRSLTPREYLANSLHQMQELVADDLDTEEKHAVDQLLAKCDPDHPLTGSLQDALAKANVVTPPVPSVLTRTRVWVRDTYRRVADLPGFEAILITFFVLQMSFKLVYVFLLIFFPGLSVKDIAQRKLISRVFQDPQLLTFTDRAELAVGCVAAVLVLLGVLYFRRSRLDAYRYFRASILVNIFLTEIFIFAREQFEALLGFGFDLLVLVALGNLIMQEKERTTPSNPSPRGARATTGSDHPENS